MKAIPFPTWTRALFAPALVFVATAGSRVYQTDFWHHLARGRAIVETGTLVDHDLFTYTVPGAAFQDTNWLPQLLYYRLFCIGGLDLVQLVNSLVLAGTIGFLVWLCRRACGSLLLSGAVGVFTFFGLWQLLIIRPQTFSLFLFVALLTVLELAERRPRWLFVPPFVLALWVNVHGGFPVGLALVGCYSIAAVIESAWQDGRGMLRDRGVWARSICWLACVAATMLNPYGWRVYQYVGITSSVAASRHIDEWLPPGLDMLVGKMLVASLLALLVLFALPGRRPCLRELCLLACFLPFAIGSARMLAWWLLVAAPVTARLLAAHLPAKILRAENDARPSLASGLIFAILILAVVLSVPGLEQFNPLVGTVRTSHRVESELEAVCCELSENDGGRIFSRFEWSEYLGWALAPRYTVFMDGRIEIFPDEVWREYAALTRGRADWQELLDRYDVDYLLLDTSGYHAELLPQVERSPSWEPVFQAGDAVLFARRPQAASISSRNSK
jgi:hypothetical protein